MPAGAGLFKVFSVPNAVRSVASTYLCSTADVVAHIDAFQTTGVEVLRLPFAFPAGVNPYNVASDAEAV